MIEPWFVAPRMDPAAGDRPAAHNAARLRRRHGQPSALPGVRAVRLRKQCDGDGWIMARDTPMGQGPPKDPGRGRVPSMPDHNPRPSGNPSPSRTQPDCWVGPFVILAHRHVWPTRGLAEDWRVGDDEAVLGKQTKDLRWSSFGMGWGSEITEWPWWEMEAAGGAVTTPW